MVVLRSIAGELETDLVCLRPLREEEDTVSLAQEIGQESPQSFHLGGGEQ